MTDEPQTIAMPVEDLASLVRISVRLERALWETERERGGPRQEADRLEEQLLQKLAKLLQCDPHEVVRKIEHLVETENDRKRIYYLSSLLSGKEVVALDATTGAPVRSEAVPWLREQLERLFAGKDSVEIIAHAIRGHEVERTARYTELVAALGIDPLKVSGSLHEEAVATAKQMRTHYENRNRKQDVY